MSREYRPQTKTVNFIFMNGGVGDHIASLTAVDYVSKKYTWITILLWVPDFLVEFSKHVLPHINVRGYSQMKKQYDPSKATKTTEWDRVISPMKIHSVDYAFLKLCDENPDITFKNYLQIKKEETSVLHDRATDYVVITTGYTAKVREFPAKSINEITNYLNNKNIMPVFLGQTQTKTGAIHVIKGQFDKEIDFSKGINLIDKTSLLQAAQIIAHAKAVVGVDNGLMHVAGCTQTPIVGGFTTVSPEIRWPIRHNELGWKCYAVMPDVSLNCSFCQEKTNFLYNHDYTKCMYQDNLCTIQMTSDKFIKHLEVVLG